MNQQNSTADQEAAKAAEVESAAAAKKAAAEKAAANEAVAAEETKGSETVTLVHPVTGDKIKVVKPSADYTNYVRSYGYREV